ncbi:phosphoenolpyruvate--protein phosphotransferase [Dongshaea marina]|uniref:phosphoenolpyruvate--protein phosphotransferase n=1 Tax=Dongshaea marina TaxID=2047966 RepID=UPI0022779C4C|nr:phosphoenolpyruvate--protein phosphotransferase [Dongshaea marina]
MQAIETVSDDQGVLVLMDLGSALLSAEMALELVDPAIAAKTKLCAAPVVEGTMAAAVAAAAGLPLETVCEEALGALSAKQEHLGELEVPASSSNSELGKLDVAQALTFEWLVRNPHGLHARPAAAIVNAIAGFESEVQLCKGEHRVNAKSLNGIARLGVLAEEQIQLRAQGPDARELVEAFSALAQRDFGESIDSQVAESLTEVSASESSESCEPGAIAGIPVCEGIVSGPAVIFKPVMSEPSGRSFSSHREEMECFEQARSRVSEQLTRQYNQAVKQLGEEHAQIFEAHRLMLMDPELSADVSARIESGVHCEQAWFDAVTELAQSYRNATSDYMRAREADVWDIGRQLMNELCGETQEMGVVLSQPSILFAEDLLPSDTAKLDSNKVLAICLSGGGSTSHTAILARAKGIPALVQVRDCLQQVSEGQSVCVDGFEGRLWLEPGAEQLEKLAVRREQWVLDRQQQQLSARQQAITLDGRQVPVMANIGGAEDVSSALELGAEGVGLMRTEFLFQGCSELPSELHQFEVYREIASRFSPNPLTIRSLDVGGDKPLATYPMASEENPFLGLRGIRLCLQDHKLLKDQLKAVLRANASCGNIQLMIPMIAKVAELKAVKALLEECRQELGLDAGRYPMPVGIMIEVPAAVLCADALAEESDFFSIGTNDLTQYVMAADRGNPAVSELVDYHQPAVLRAIELTCEAAKNAGIPVSMCGEMAGDPKVTELLLKLGVEKLSASASRLPALKSQIRKLFLA